MLLHEALDAFGASQVYHHLWSTRRVGTNVMK